MSPKCLYNYVIIPTPQYFAYVYESCVQPILTYGSDVLGVNKAGRDAVDKVLLWFLRLILRVKATTSNIITLGEFGKMSPGVICETNCILYFLRLKVLPQSSLANIIFREQMRLHHLGFKTWYGKVWELAQMHGIDLNCDYNKAEVKSLVISTFKTNWLYALNDIAKNTLLRTYSTFKYDFKFEPFIYMVKYPKYRIAIAKFRTSSHTLENVGGIPNRKPLVAERLCHLCRVVEDEIHFLRSCPLYYDERRALFNTVISKCPQFSLMREQESFVFFLTSEDADILSWTGKFIYNALKKRTIILFYLFHI